MKLQQSMSSFKNAVPCSQSRWWLWSSIYNIYNIYNIRPKTNLNFGRRSQYNIIHEISNFDFSTKVIVVAITSEVVRSFPKVPQLPQMLNENLIFVPTLQRKIVFKVTMKHAWSLRIKLQNVSRVLSFFGNKIFAKFGIYLRFIIFFTGGYPRILPSIQIPLQLTNSDELKWRFIWLRRDCAKIVMILRYISWRWFRVG